MATVGGVVSRKFVWITLMLAVGVHFPSLVEAGRFLQQKEISSSEVEMQLLTDLAASYRRTDGTKRIEHLEDSLRPIFATLPKDQHGALTHSAVRYALHRVFMQRNAWFIRGLDPNMESPPISSNASLALDSVPILPSLLQGTLERSHANRGLNLRETAALGAAIDDIVHRDARSRLSMAYDVLSMNEDKDLSAEESQLMIGTYMTIYMLGNNFSNWTREEIQNKELRYFNSKRWKKVYAWVQGVRNTVDVTGLTSYAGLEKVVENLGEQFGTFNEEECRGLKNALMSIEGRAAGRVRLSDFYNKSRYGVWGFREKIDYLRTLGALDESNYSNPQVIIPNYVASMPQCLKASGVYSICCRDECEGLLSHIESKVAAPEAFPDQLVGLVEQLSTDTQASRKLTPALVERIREVADHNGGLVPIHGRLFAQWMHHVFPRECPYPHKAGSTSPQTPDEWMKQSGESDSQASEEEMLQHIRPDDTCPIDGCDDDFEVDLPWTTAEELLISPGLTSSRTQRVMLHVLFRSVLPSETQLVVYMLALLAFGVLSRDRLAKIQGRGILSKQICCV